MSGGGAQSEGGGGTATHGTVMAPRAAALLVWMGAATIGWPAAALPGRWPVRFPDVHRVEKSGLVLGLGNDSLLLVLIARTVY